MLFIKDDRIYQHKTLRINYTTYDMRRESEVINPKRSTADVMFLSPESSTAEYDIAPFWYARVLGIFSVRAILKDNQDAVVKSENISFLWARWFRRQENCLFGDKHLRLEKVTFIGESDSTNPFGFLDPNFVIRAALVIPNFDAGRCRTLLDPSRLARAQEKGCVDEDYISYYINMQVRIINTNGMNVCGL